jgi:hypothetical protein
VTGAGRSERACPDVVVEFQADGVRWLVTEHAGNLVPGARGDRCLIFMSADVIRRVWRYPLDWRSLPPERLIALSWSA